MSEPSSSPEVGRELKADELQPRRVVVIFPPGRNVGMTFWVADIDLTAGVVSFFSGEMNWTVLNFIKADGTIVDDQDRQVRIHEYLGKV